MSDFITWVTQTDLGTRYDVGPKTIGKWLIDAGLREGRVPTTGAIQAGFAKPCTTEQGMMFFVWDRERTIEALRKAGRRAKGSPPPELIGPFELRTMADDSFEIVGGDGLVATVIGERNANRMMKVLDVLWQNDIKKAAEMQEAAVAETT